MDIENISKHKDENIVNVDADIWFIDYDYDEHDTTEHDVNIDVDISFEGAHQRHPG